MSADFFLWGGFVFTLLWHLWSWACMTIRNPDSDQASVQTLCLINLGLSGVALCMFGSLAFGTQVLMK